MCQQEITTLSTPSGYWQHHRQQQQQNGFQETNRLATESSLAPLPPSLMIPNANTNNESHYYQYPYQYNQSSSAWTLTHSPVTPPSAQQDIMLMNHSLCDSVPTQQHHDHSRQSSMTTTTPITTTACTERSVEATATALVTSTQQQEQQKHSRFHTVLQAMTSVTQKTELSLTYLNRNQTYGIQIEDKLGNDGLIQSQFTITFHDPAHQKVAFNYWKFWIGQHKDPENARSLDLDPHQSIGILNVRYPSFDRIAFDWHGRHGAKLFVRFHCLSTDFSRIKGVKGIPLRICMSSQISMVDQDPLFQRTLVGSFHPNDKCETEMNYIEQSFCKVKLFRDKGAERKYKDDAKQLGKQFEKILHDGDSGKHPMWIMYNRSVPYTIFNRISDAPSEVSPKPVPYEMICAIKQQRQAKYKPKRQQTTLPHYQQHSHHYQPYTKRPTATAAAATAADTLSLLPPPLTSSSSGTVTVPTQLYFSGHDSDLSSSSLSPPPLMSDNDNGYPMAVSSQQKHVSLVAPPLLISLAAPKHPKVMAYDSKQALYAYHYHQQQQQQQQQLQHNHDRLSPTPSSSSDSSHLAGWMYSL